MLKSHGDVHYNPIIGSEKTKGTMTNKNFSQRSQRLRSARRVKPFSFDKQ